MHFAVMKYVFTGAHSRSKWFSALRVTRRVSGPRPAPTFSSHSLRKSFQSAFASPWYVPVMSWASILRRSFSAFRWPCSPGPHDLHLRLPSGSIQLTYQLDRPGAVFLDLLVVLVYPRTGHGEPPHRRADPGIMERAAYPNGHGPQGREGLLWQLYAEFARPAGGLPSPPSPAPPWTGRSPPPPASRRSHPSSPRPRSPGRRRG